MNASDSLNNIYEIAAHMRSTFESVLQQSIGTSRTDGSCLYAAIFLAMTLRKFGDARTRVRGGGQEAGGGFRDTVGKTYGHYWVEGLTVEGFEFVADITADQFGLDKVVVLLMQEARHTYWPGNQAMVNKHVLDETKTWGINAEELPDNAEA